MTIKYKSNLCGGILSILLGLLVIVVIPVQIGVDGASSQAYGITSRTVPYGMAILMIVCGAGLILQSLLLKKDMVKVLILKREAVAFGYMIGLVAFAFLFKHSYLLATLFLGMLTLVMLKCRKIHYYILEVMIVVCLYLIFTKFLNVRLPALL